MNMKARSGRGDDTGQSSDFRIDMFFQEPPLHSNFITLQYVRLLIHFNVLSNTNIVTF